MVLDQADAAGLTQGVSYLVGHIIGARHGEAYDANRSELALRRSDRNQLRIVAHRADRRIHAVGMNSGIYNNPFIIWGLTFV